MSKGRKPQKKNGRDALLAKARKTYMNAIIEAKKVTDDHTFSTLIQEAGKAYDEAVLKAYKQSGVPCRILF